MDRHRPELDAVRGLAILMVVVYHGLYWGQVHRAGVLGTVARLGWLGVQLFFVLSGFLITGILRSARERPDYYQRFYWRRALRILPAYALTLSVLAVTGIADRPFLTASALFGANLVSLVGIPLQYGPLWSLAVEEQFYLLWPSAVRRLGTRALVLLALAVVVGVTVARYVGFRLGVDDTWNGTRWVYTWFVADGLAIGALLALFVNRPSVTRQQLARVSIALAAVGALTILIGLPFGVLYRTTALGATLKLLPWELIFAGMIGLALVTRVAPKWLRFLGSISYGLYLVHALVFIAYDRVAPAAIANNTVLRFLIVALISIGIATLSRWTFEEAFLRLKDRPQKPVADRSPTVAGS